MLTLGLAHLMLGQKETAVDLLQKTLREDLGESANFTARIQENLELLYLISGDYFRLQQSAQRRLILAQNAHLPIDTGWANYFLGRCVLYTVPFRCNNA